MMKPGWRYLIYAVCGALMAIPFSIDSLWIVSWFAFVPVLFLEFSFDNKYKHSYFAAYKRGVCFFYPYGIVTFLWFCEMYPLEFTGMTKGAAICVILLGVLGLSLLQTIAWAFYFVLIHFVRSRLKNPYDILSLFLAPVVWIVLEWVHTQTWAGVPWSKLALGQVKARVLIQSSSLFGPYFVSFIMILFASFLAYAFVSVRRGDKRMTYIMIALAAVMFSCNVLYGAVRINNYDPEGDTVRVAAIQGNIDSKEKWSNDLSISVSAYDRLTEKAAEDGAKLIVWPETAIPTTAAETKSIKDNIEELSRKTDSVLLVGTFGTDENEDKLANSIMEVDPGQGFTGEVYVKRRLVPFGEFVPMRDFIMTLVPPLNELTIIGDDIAAGNGAQIIETKYGNVGAIICFDSIYESLARDSVAQGAQILCVSTNDSWFGDSSAVYEHNAHSVLRAIENGRYVVRAANTGISSVISPTGEMIDYRDPLVEGYICSDVLMISEDTLYTAVGNLIVYLAMGMIALCGFAAVVFDRRK